MRSFISKSLFLAVALLAGVMTTAFKAEGLEILFALYGDLNANHADNKRVDATEKIKAYVGSQASVGLPTAVKNTLFTAAGIDPAFGVNKGLAIVYVNAGNVRLHFSFYDDTTTIPSDTDYDLGVLNTSANLQVLAAVYGELNKSGAASKSDFATSKTVASTKLLQNNVIYIPPGIPTGEQKHQLFGDPAFGVNKGFFVVGSSGGKLFIGCFGHTEVGQLSSTTYQFSATPAAASTSTPTTTVAPTSTPTTTVAPTSTPTTSTVGNIKSVKFGIFAPRGGSLAKDDRYVSKCTIRSGVVRIDNPYWGSSFPTIYDSFGFVFDLIEPVNGKTTCQVTIYPIPTDVPYWFHDGRITETLRGEQILQRSGIPFKLREANDPRLNPWLPLFQ